MARSLWNEMLAGVPKEVLAARFMNTLVQMAGEIADRIRKDGGPETVVLSGGVFQNMFLLRRLRGRLEQLGFTVYTHRRVSTNDEGVSLGQAMAALRGGF